MKTNNTVVSPYNQQPKNTRKSDMSPKISLKQHHVHTTRAAAACAAYVEEEWETPQGIYLKHLECYELLTGGDVVSSN